MQRLLRYLWSEFVSRMSDTVFSRLPLYVVHVHYTRRKTEEKRKRDRKSIVVAYSTHCVYTYEPIRAYQDGESSYTCKTFRAMPLCV